MVENSNNYLDGIDVSAANGVISWPKVAATGKVHYAFAKCSEGSTSVDGQLKANWKGIKSVGFPRGAYHYSRPFPVPGDAEKEADHYCDVMLSLGLEPEDMLMLDLEDAGRTHNGLEFYIWVLAWLDRVELRTGKIALLYTGGPFFNQHAGALTDDIMKRFLRHPLFLAAYVIHPDDFIPIAFRSLGWRLLQSGGDIVASGDTVLRLDGIATNVDHDRFKGTVEELKQFALSLNIQKESAEMVVPQEDSKPAEGASVAPVDVESKNVENAPEAIDNISNQTSTAMVGTKNNLWTILNVVWQFILRLIGKK